MTQSAYWPGRTAMALEGSAGAAAGAASLSACLAWLVSPVRRLPRVRTGAQRSQETYCGAGPTLLK